MRSRTRYLIAVGMLLVLAILVQTHMPKRFSWETTYAPDDRDPFGCYVFDSIMRSSMPRGYEARPLTLRQLSVADTLHNVLIVAKDVSLTHTDTAAIGRLLRRGSTIVIAPEYKFEVCDTLSSLYGVAKQTSSYFRLYMLKESFTNPDDSTRYRLTEALTVWLGNDGLFGEASFRSPKELGNDCLDIDSTVSDNDVLACMQYYWISYSDEDILPGPEPPREIDRDEYDQYFIRDGEYYGRSYAPSIVRRRIGRGQIIFCASPFSFTNYAALDPDMARNTNRLMTFLADRPTVRTTSFLEQAAAAQEKSSPLYYMLSQKPLRTAIHICLAAIVLALVFMARRRQRAIPVYTRPRNSMLDFARLLGTIHFQRREPMEPAPSDDDTASPGPDSPPNENKENTAI